MILLLFSSIASQSPLGGRCGGSVNPPLACEPGLVCIPTLNAPDAGGTCQREFITNTALPTSSPSVTAPATVGLGTRCGGNIFNAAVCSTGLTCQITGAPDVGGRCVSATVTSIGSNPTTLGSNPAASTIPFSTPTQKSNNAQGWDLRMILSLFVFPLL